MSYLQYLHKKLRVFHRKIVEPTQVDMEPTQPLPMKRESADVVWSLKQDEHRKNLGCLGYIGDEILPSYIGIIISHYKDPY